MSITKNGGPTATQSPEIPATWRAFARCIDNPDRMFVRGAAQHDAVTICRHCPVVAPCGADALDSRTEFGVWGGMTERRRRALLKDHPDIESWANFFASHRPESTTTRLASTPCQNTRDHPHH
ncbi:WhiB family transcriptional regulator [Rhodococcus tukisamuensis]|uniref:Transcriptional regulator WhiB n=1 Tax=Rhodococcus tukisamuensis TaxID=168276 RepID=A0A1G7DX72_9NOCA|nr:WhiB family transcriptional regulator [Rhodococcus tukisamuensis]SDE56084.1 WhiB family transcriptional regulator, redox-sensing transcriptional regulator [Rhodococcus tukisamuensis]